MKSRNAIAGRVVTGISLLAASLWLGLIPPSGFAEEKVRGHASYLGLGELALASGPADIEAVALPQGSPLQVEAVDFPSEFTLFAERRGNRLELRVEVPPLWTGPTLGARTPRVILSIPRGTVVELNSASGDVRLAGYEASRLSVGTSSGDVSLRDATASILASSSSGDIKVERCKGALDLRSSSGDIRVASSTGDVTLNSSSGDALFTAVEGRLSVTTSSGDVRFEGTKGSLAIRTSSGSISGEGISLTANSSFDTNSGSTSLRLDNSPAQLRFQLVSTGGSLSAASARGEHRLETGSGPILVKGSSSSGDQSYSLR